MIEARAARAVAEVLDGRVAIVTGGGRGLGAEICRCLAEAGASVVAVERDATLAAGIDGELRDGRRPGRALVADITDDEAVARTLADVERSSGRIDILVNNAGIDATLPVDELTPEQWDRIMAVNLRAPFVLSRAVLPGMASRGQGHIVNVVSTAAKRAWANASAYHASKWGLLGLSHALHVEARVLGVKVTAVVAGGMRTPFLLDRFADLDPGVLQEPRNVAEAIRFALTTPRETVIPELLVLPMRETSWP